MKWVKELEGCFKKVQKPLKDTGAIKGLGLPPGKFESVEYHEYQIHQLELGLFRIRLIVDGELPHEAREKIRRNIKDLAGQDTRVHVDVVDQIQPAPGGKFRWVMSDVSDVAQRMLTESEDNDREASAP